MAIASFDFAVLGSTPLARLLAGLLATAQGKRVCLVSDSNSPFRLTRGVDLSVAPVTRPETWALLAKTVPEAQKLLGRAGGKSAIERVDPVFIAESPASAEMLAHLRHTAQGFGHAVDRLQDGRFGPGTIAVQLHDAFFLSRPQLEPALNTWLARSGVRQVPGREAKVTVKRDGTTSITIDNDAIDAAQTILADDAAILAHLSPDSWSAVLRAEPAISLMTEPTNPLAGTPMVFLDRGVTLCQRSTRGIAAIALGRMDEALARIGATLIGQAHVRRAGQAVFRSLTSLDGAPVVGQLRSSKVIAIAGLGMTGAYLAPALARFIAGKATDEEVWYFSARDQSSARSAVADYQRVMPEAAGIEAQS